MSKINAKINLLEKKMNILKQNLDKLYEINFKQAEAIVDLRKKFLSIDAPLVLKKNKK